MEVTYRVKGIHCASCELIIEKGISGLEGVNSAEVSRANGTVKIDYAKIAPTTAELNHLFEKQGYSFSEESFQENHNFLPYLFALAAIAIFLLLEKFGLSSRFSIGGTSSLLTFFAFGLVAGASSCAALVGGLVLSLSKQWSELGYSGKVGRFEPHLLFNLGRIVAYGILGLILGYVGESLKFSPSIYAVAVVLVSIIMVILALQMLGVKAINLSLPKKITRKITKERKAAPLLTGALTVFLPCGFTIMAEGAAVLSGGYSQGMLIMALFALGTAIPLLLIGAFSATMLGSKFSEGFMRAAGVLIIFFVAYNLNVQFNIIRLSEKSLGSSSVSSSAPVQYLSAEYSEGTDIVPNTFKVKAGEPVEMVINVHDDAYGCMGSIMVEGLYEKPQLLRKGRTIIMNFTPSKPGDYQITCAMGVVRGSIEVVE